MADDDSSDTNYLALLNLGNFTLAAQGMDDQGDEGRDRREDSQGMDIQGEEGRDHREESRESSLSNNDLETTLINDELEETERQPPSVESVGFWTRWKYRLYRILQVLLIMLFLVLFATYLDKIIKFFFLGNGSRCTYRNSPSGQITVVSLPYAVNRTAHETLLNELHELERLSSLMNTQSSVSLSVISANQALTKNLACALRRSSRADSHHKKAPFVLLNEITLIHERTLHLLSNASRLHDLYSSIKPAYYGYNSTATNDLEAAQLGRIKHWLVVTQPYTLRWLGFVFKERYWDPWMEKREKLKVVQSALVAFEKESGRLEQIQQVAREVSHNLEHLAVTLMETEAQIARDHSLTRWGWDQEWKGSDSWEGWRKHWIRQQLQGDDAWEEWRKEWLGQRIKGGGSWERRLKDWFRQYVARYVDQGEGPLRTRQFDTWWTNLDCRCSA